MTAAIKRFLFRTLSTENYIRLLQSFYFLLFDSGILRLSKEFDYHYNIKKIINKGDVIVDIGANLGYYSIPFAKRTGPTGEVHSVEPIPLYNKIFNEKARRYPWIKLYPYALGGGEKQVEMVMSLSEGYLRTGLPHVYDPARDEQAEKLTFTVEMKNPSHLFAHLTRLDYVKCDVEGFEYEVLSHMRDVIARLRPKVQVEVWKQNEPQMLELFAGMGYKAFRLEKGALVPFADSRTDGDIIFIP